MGDPIANYTLGKQMRTSCVHAHVVRSRQASVERKVKRQRNDEGETGEEKDGKGKFIKLN